jgi:hypothetical protein
MPSQIKSWGFLEDKVVKRLVVGRVVPTPDLGDIERDSEGNVLHLSQRDARNYCVKHGSRLATLVSSLWFHKGWEPMELLKLSTKIFHKKRDVVRIEISQMVSKGYVLLFLEMNLAKK